MGNIDTYIRTMLLEGKTFNLPGLGGFIKRDKSAEISNAQQKITPPLKTIAFNKLNTANDNMLTSFLVDHDKLSPDSARNKINEYVYSLKKELKEKGCVEIPEVGVFEKTGADIQFKPLIKDEDLADNFGLDLIEIDIPENEHETNISQSFNATNSKSKRQLNPAWIIVGIALLLAPAIFFSITRTSLPNKIAIMLKTKENTSNESLDDEIKRINATLITEQDSVHTTIEQHLEANTNQNKALLPEQVQKEAYYSQFKHFYIVAGSFNNYTFAQEHKNSLIARGFDHAQIIASEQNYRVVIAEYNNRQQALKQLENLRRNYNSNLWVLSMQ